MKSFELPVNQMEEIGKGGGIRKGKRYLYMVKAKLHKIIQNYAHKKLSTALFCLIEMMSSQNQFDGETSEITVICTAAAAAFLSFTFGIVTGGAVHYCISARKKKDYRPCTAEHEQQLNSLTPQTAEIELNQNVAYEAVLPSDII